MAQNQEILVIPRQEFDKLFKLLDDISKRLSGNAKQDAVYMTMEELCECLQMSEVTVYKYIRERGLPTIKIGTHRRFIKEKIDKWISEQN